MGEYKQSTFKEIIKSESAMVLEAHGNYGKFFDHAVDAYNLEQSFLTSLPSECFLFGSFFSQFKKHSLLTILSAVRQHNSQAAVNLRFLIESGIISAYILHSHTEITSLISKSTGELMREASKEKAYIWIEKYDPSESSELKRIKKLINKYDTHSNPESAYRNFQYTPENIQTPFFDFVDIPHTQTLLWITSQCIIRILKLIYGVNKSVKKLNVYPNYLKEASSLVKYNVELNEILRKNINYKFK